MDIFDIDSESSYFVPVGIRLRGREYVLGETAHQFLGALEVAKDLEGKPETEILRHIRPLLAVLAPEAPMDLSPAEEMALIKPLAEVLKRFSRVSFPQDEPQGTAVVAG